MPSLSEFMLGVEALVIDLDSRPLHAEHRCRIPAVYFDWIDYREFDTGFPDFRDKMWAFEPQKVGILECPSKVGYPYRVPISQ